MVGIFDSHDEVQKENQKLVQGRDDFLEKYDYSHAIVKRWKETFGMDMN